MFSFMQYPIAAVALPRHQAHSQTTATGVMPQEEAISSSTWELVQMMALLEAGMVNVAYALNILSQSVFFT